MKNEGPFILEWVAHNLAIGVTDFLIYTNDCDDGTDAIWQRLERLGIGQHRVNTILRRGVQKSALHHALAEDAVAQADWLCVLDVDEFINIHAGQGTIGDMWAACPDANVFAMTWRIFGDGGQIGFDAGLICDTFCHAAPLHIPTPAQAWGVKTLFKNNGLFERIGVHVPLDPVAKKFDQICTVNGDGVVLPDSHKVGKWRSDKSSVGYRMVQLNHYAVRSVESYLIKRDRGRVNHMADDQGMDYWQMMSHNQHLDRSITKRSGATGEILNHLMADAELKDLHDAAVVWHKNKITELKQRDSFAALFDAIVGQIARRPKPQFAE